MQIPNFPYRLNDLTMHETVSKILQEICGEFLNLWKVMNS